MLKRKSVYVFPLPTKKAENRTMKEVIFTLLLRLQQQNNYFTLLFETDRIQAKYLVFRLIIKSIIVFSCEL